MALPSISQAGYGHLMQMLVNLAPLVTFRLFAKRLRNFGRGQLYKEHFCAFTLHLDKGCMILLLSFTFHFIL